MIMLADRGSAVAERSYLKSLAGYLVRQPRAVAIACCDPNHGLATEVFGRIVIADLARWCAEHSEPIAHVLRDDFQRRVFGAPDAAPITREGRETLDQLHARHGKNWGLRGMDPVLDARNRARGIDPATAEEIAQAKRAEAAEKTRQFNARLFAAEYARRGLEPVYDGKGLMLSPSLVAAVNPAALVPVGSRRKEPVASHEEAAE